MQARYRIEDPHGFCKLNTQVDNSERPPAKTIVDAGFHGLDRYVVAADEGGAITAKTESVVLDLGAPVVLKRVFRPNAGHPAVGGPASRNPHAKAADARGDIGPSRARLAIDKPVVEGVAEP